MCFRRNRLFVVRQAPITIPPEAFRAYRAAKGRQRENRHGLRLATEDVETRVSRIYDHAALCFCRPAPTMI